MVPRYYSSANIERHVTRFFYTEIIVTFDLVATPEVTFFYFFWLLLQKDNLYVFLYFDMIAQFNNVYVTTTQSAGFQVSTESIDNLC